MITKEMLETSSPRSKFPAAGGSHLVSSAATEIQRRYGMTRFTIIKSSADKVAFFTDDHCYGYKVLPKHFVPTSFSLPMRVAPRPGFKDGMVYSIRDFLDVFAKDVTILDTIEELVDHLNK